MAFKSGECIKRLQKILTGLGVKFTQSSHRIRAIFSPISGVRYTVYFNSHGGRLHMEAPVFKVVSGPDRYVRLFFATLLTYNSAIYPFAFAQASVKQGRAQLMLRYTPDCDTLSAYDIKTAVESLNEIFVYHVPRLKDLAQEYGLEFTGVDEFNITGLVKAILGL